MTAASQIAGVDVGGTFTDIFVYDQATGQVSVAKVATSKPDQSRGFIDGIEAAAGPDRLGTVVHGTTVATNALLERKGARTGIITTAGFRDVLEMRRRDRPATWGLWGMFEPVVARDLRLEVDERTLADGTIRTPVDPEQVRDAARQLLSAGAEAVCVFFINGYANPENERAAAAAVRQAWPNPYVTAATEILPEIREFERCSTAVLNAYLQPRVAGYLDRLQHGLKRRAGSAEVLIVQSNGGVMDIDTARQVPVRTALSGPAAGVIAAQYIAGEAGFDNVITCDMGGTSFDVSLIAGGEIALAAQTQIDFGMVVRSPMVEISTIGAGGGSIAHVDDGGLLEIGPESAGSDPGPVAYGLGNERPTVTDANLVLGRINPERPIGGKLDRLDAEAAGQAIERHIARPLGLDVMAAAEAIIRVANARMAGAIRLVSIERGHDPKKFAVMPFGGGGALHSGAMMQEIGLAAAIVPRYPGVTSAIGCVVADMRHDRVQTINALLDDLDPAALRETVETIAAGFESDLARSSADLTAIERAFEFDMLYVGQTHTVTVPAGGDAARFSHETLRAAFETAYAAAFGRLLKNIPVRVMNLRVVVTGRRPKLDLSGLAPTSGKSLDQCKTGTRRVYHGGKWHEASVYERLDLPVGATIAGPALAEQPDTTIFIDPDLEGKVDRFGNLIITRQVDM